MGMIFSIYTYSSYPFYIILTNKPYPPASLLPAFSYIPCHPIYSLPVFIRRFANRSRILFSSAPSVFAHPLRRFVFRHATLRGFHSYRFIVSSGVPWAFRSASFRFSSRSCRLVGTGRRFLSARFLVPSLSRRGVRFPEAASCLPSCRSSRCGVAVLRFVRSVVLLVGSSCVPGFFRLVGRLVFCVSCGVSFSSSCLPCRQHLPCPSSLIGRWRPRLISS